MPEKRISYLDKQGEVIDLESKRLKFWLETVPPDIRRIEYDLWKRYRLLHHLDFYQHAHKRAAGRFLVTPEYPKEQEEIDWKKFSQSFLMGKNRKERIQEIIHETKTDLPKIFEYYGDKIQKPRIDIIALSGSFAYGPRKKGSSFSDIDLRFLLHTPDSSLNIEMMPDTAIQEIGTPYHIIGTGTTDVARGSNSDIHWLLYPHYPIVNRVNDGKLKEIIVRLVQETQGKMGVLQQRLETLNDIIEERRKGIIIG